MALCREAWVKNHFWPEARAAALRRDRNKCIRCGRHYGLEVNHIRPLASIIADPKLRRAPGCQHHLVGLETLCNPCHRKTTNQQIRSGLIRSGWKRKP